MNIFTIILISGLNLVFFFVGAKVGRAIVNGNKIELPNPIEAIKENRVQREAQKSIEREQERIDTIMHNINSYDGTSNNQKDIPRG